MLHRLKGEGYTYHTKLSLLPLLALSLTLHLLSLDKNLRREMMVTLLCSGLLDPSLFNEAGLVGNDSGELQEFLEQNEWATDPMQED